MVAPALIYAVWDDLSAYIRQRPIRLLGLLGVGLLGLIPYAYMYLRAQAGGEWVYGDPGTLSGLIDQFMGREATRFIGVPGSLDALVANLNLVNGVILIDVTLPGVLAGGSGCLAKQASPPGAGADPGWRGGVSVPRLCLHRHPLGADPDGHAQPRLRLAVSGGLGRVDGWLSRTCLAALISPRNRERSGVERWATAGCTG
ncbi:MAG: hypothetical protein U0703_12150 [Anaerolineae bacterium]